MNIQRLLQNGDYCNEALSFGEVNNRFYGRNLRYMVSLARRRKTKGSGAIRADFGLMLEIDRVVIKFSSTTLMKRNTVFIPVLILICP